MKPDYNFGMLIHKAAMEDAFPQPKSGPACHLCRHARAPEKPREPFTCSQGLPMDAKRCSAFHDARKPSFDYAKVYG